MLTSVRVQELKSAYLRIAPFISTSVIFEKLKSEPLALTPPNRDFDMMTCLRKAYSILENAKLQLLIVVE